MKTKLALVTIAVLIAVGVMADAAVPPMMSYQGKLLQPSGAPVPDGTFSMQFAIYDVPTGGTALWSETNPSVQVKGGLFATLLGSINNLPANIFDNPDRFFGVTVGSDPEMMPRQQVASTAFAFRAAVAGTVDDGAITTGKIADGAVTTGKIADSGVTNTKIGDTAVSTRTLQDGSVTAIKLSASAIMLGYAQITSGWSTSSIPYVPVPGLSVAVNVPEGGRKLKITFWCRSLSCDTALQYAGASIWDGVVGGGTFIAETLVNPSMASQEFPASVISIQSPPPGLRTYSVGMHRFSSGTGSLSASPNAPAFLLVELI